MRDDEQFKDFYIKHSDITNSSLYLRKEILKEQNGKENSQNLTDHFYYKVTTTEESKEIEKMKVELVGSFITYELHLQRRKKENGFGIAFKIEKDEEVVDG
ncbi:Uncharacterized protein Adt_48457 [Abeliophyllum distichum]|uniref:Uncharacterized protein n=1 Tax=Abeliophyllum distichum TaxID=126358 RepID=A0ABD1NSZ1_9LAMI